MGMVFKNLGEQWDYTRVWVGLGAEQGWAEGEGWARGDLIKGTVERDFSNQFYFHQKVHTPEK